MTRILLTVNQNQIIYKLHMCRELAKHTYIYICLHTQKNYMSIYDYMYNH